MALGKERGRLRAGFVFVRFVWRLRFCAVFVRHAFGAESGRGIVPVRVKKADGSYEKKQLYESSHALLIGVSDYTAGWDDLESIPAEMAKVEALLRSQGFSVEKRMNPDA